MEKVRAVPRREGISKDRMAKLKAKGELPLVEAAEFLGWSPRTFYNRRNLAKKNETPWLVPQGYYDHSGEIVYAIAELEAFKLKLRRKA